MKIGLVLLTLNEIDGLNEIWNKIPKEEFDEIFAVDGGSKDGTIEFFNDNKIPIVGQSRRGRGEAFRQAFRASKSDVLIFFSPDGNEDPKDLVKMKNVFHNHPGTDLVIASRMMPDSRNEEDDQIFRWRKWACNALSLLANMIFNHNFSSNYITDTINGYRGFNRDSFDKLNLTAIGYTIEYQSTMRSLILNMDIKEIPTIEGSRVGGESYANSFPTGLKLFKCFINEFLKRNTYRRL